MEHNREHRKSGEPHQIDHSASQISPQKDDNNPAAPSSNSHSNSEPYDAEESVLEEPTVIRHHVAGSPPSKPRLFYNGKDIALCLIPLVIFCLLIAALSGNLGVRYGFGRKQDQYPPYEAAIAASAAAHELPFRIKFPHVPGDWKPNSGSKANVGSHIVFNLGWLTAHHKYLQLSQSSASTEQLTKYLQDNLTLEIAHPIETGWKWFVLENGRKIGITSWHGTTFGLYGNAPDEEFKIMITALEHSAFLKQ